MPSRFGSWKGIVIPIRPRRRSAGGSASGALRAGEQQHAAALAGDPVELGDELRADLGRLPVPPGAGRRAGRVELVPEEEDRPRLLALRLARVGEERAHVVWPEARPLGREGAHVDEERARGGRQVAGGERLAGAGRAGEEDSGLQARACLRVALGVDERVQHLVHALEHVLDADDVGAHSGRVGGALAKERASVLLERGRAQRRPAGDDLEVGQTVSFRSEPLAGGLRMRCRWGVRRDGARSYARRARRSAHPERWEAPDGSPGDLLALGSPAAGDATLVHGSLEPAELPSRRGNEADLVGLLRAYSRTSAHGTARSRSRGHAR